jgi:8-oxo-dGTP pyrophosphatase MutT (NUDIX family)
MSFVYAIAFGGSRFLMVYNPHRHGWEMPGGRIEPGEGPENAVVREFREETGQCLVPRASVPFRDGHIFTGDLSRCDSDGEMEWHLFDALPSELAFPEVEYIEQLRWARQVMGIVD